MSRAKRTTKTFYSCVLIHAGYDMQTKQNTFCKNYSSKHTLFIPRNAVKTSFCLIWPNKSLHLNNLCFWIVPQLWQNLFFRLNVFGEMPFFLTYCKIAVMKHEQLGTPRKYWSFYLENFLFKFWRLIVVYWCSFLMFEPFMTRIWLQNLIKKIPT